MLRTILFESLEEVAEYASNENNRKRKIVDLMGELKKRKKRLFIFSKLSGNHRLRRVVPSGFSLQRVPCFQPCDVHHGVVQPPAVNAAATPEGLQGIELNDAASEPENRRTIVSRNGHTA